ncbi:uncharacterized protein [Watersipora subatra]|uniref:uncharacterized protein n=1 Tax=Watersipora subatra TaxID=2589382 RepID=UPI00355AFA43
MQERLIASLEGVGTGSTESLLLVSSALQGATTAYSELSRASQLSGLRLTTNLIKGLRQRTTDSSQEELIQVTDKLFSSIKQLFEFFRFPRDSSLRKIWVQKVSRLDTSNNPRAPKLLKPGNATVICEPIQQSGLLHDTGDSEVEQLKRKVIDLQKRLNQAQKEKRAGEAKLRQHEIKMRMLFNKDQLSALSRRSTRGLACELETVIKSLKLRFACGTTGYTELLTMAFPLPSIQTLQQRVQHINFLLVASMRDVDKLCCLTLDEMELNKAVEYDPSSKKVLGQITLPGHQGEANHRLVFMLGGIAKKMEAGGRVSFYWSLNVSFELKDHHNRYPCQGSATEFIADVPHVIKNLANTFLNHRTITLSATTVNKHHLPANTLELGQVEDLVRFQEDKDLKLTPYLMLGDLTNSAHIRKMNVGKALHIFSNSVGAGLQYLIEKEGRPVSYLTAAWFVKAVDKWFDLMSSRHPGGSFQIDYPIISDYVAAKDVWEYDTDLESKEPWLNDGDTLHATLNNLQDFTNIKLQKETSFEVATQGLKNIRTLSGLVLENMVPGEHPVKVTDEGMEVILAKETVKKLTGRTWTFGDASITVPKYCELRPADCADGLFPYQQSISMCGAYFQRNPFYYASRMQEYRSDSSYLGISTVSPKSASVLLEYFDEKGGELDVNHVKNPISLVVPHDSGTGGNKRDFARRFIPEGRAELLVNELIRVNTQNVTLELEFAHVTVYTQLLVFVRYETPPDLSTKTFDKLYQVDVSSSFQRGDYLGCYQDDDMQLLNGSDVYELGLTSQVKLCLNICGMQDRISQLSIVRLDETVVKGRMGIFYVSFAPLKLSASNLSIDNITDYRKVLESNASYSYSIHSNTVGCYFFDEEAMAISSKGCTVKPSPSLQYVICSCNHLTSFATGWIVAPNTIDFTILDFEPSNNATIYVTLAGTFTLYIVFVLWARHADKKDQAKLGTILMRGNNPHDRYLYDVTVKTGARTNAGTKSRVYFMASGELGETSVRPLNSLKKETLQRGQTDTYLMATPRSLGQIQYIRIWHDNSGSGASASWFLNHVLIRDIQSNEKWCFIADKWFSLDEENGKVDRVFAVAGEEQLVNFLRLFSAKAKGDLADDHLWFSVFTRPAKSRFTRVQRVSCCLLLLLLSMLTSAMFYEKSKSRSAGIKMGPFTLTSEQVYNSPASFSISVTESKKSAKKKTSKPLTFPWWCRIIAWVLLWIAVIACTIFIYLYSLDFGNDKTSKWITSMAVALLTSVLITQPVKVILMAIFFSLIVKNPLIDDLGDEDDDPCLKKDEQWLDDDRKAYHAVPACMLPLNQKLLGIIKKGRLKEVKMYAVIREIAIYCVFVSVLVITATSTHHPNSYHFKQHMEGLFVKQGDKFSQDFSKIANVSHFWSWARKTLIPGLKASPWYNDQPPVNLRGFLYDKTSRIMGYGVIRQLRMPKKCRHIKKRGMGYFREYWNWHEWIIILLSFLATVLFLIQYGYMRKITERFKDTRGDAYMKFQLMGHWTEMYHFIAGLLVFFTVLKLIKLLRFNKKMSLLAETLRHCGLQLSQFSVIFGIIFLAFVQFFHLILICDMDEFATFIKSWETCFAMMLGRFEFKEMTRSNKYSPIFFIVFMIVNLFILLNMALSIIIESFTVVKNDADKQRNEYEIVEYIFNRFKNWAGLGSSSDAAKLQQKLLMEESENEEDADLVRQFSLRVDVLIQGLRKCYVECAVTTELEALANSKDTKQVVGRCRPRHQPSKAME